MCIIIQGLHYYTECALLYRMCIFVQDVHYTGCTLLYRIPIIMQLDILHRVVSPSVPLQPILGHYMTSFIVPNVLVHGIHTLNRKGYGRKRSRLTVSYCPSRCIKGVRKNIKRSLNKAKIRGRDSISDFSNTDQRCQSLNPKCNQNPTYVLL